jgi:hypothetical protein
MTKKIPKKPKENICELCDYKSSHKGDFIKHNATLKHRRKQMELNGNPKIPIDFSNITINYECDMCSKKYGSASGLWKHKKKCSKEKVLDYMKSGELVLLLKKQYEELKDKNKEIVELYKKKSEMKNTSTNNISINIFLRDHCKEAMNLKDFLNNIKLSLDDLNYTGKNGFSKGMAKILLKNLSDIDPINRPIHCTDKKRLQFYIKDENKWEKDNGNKKLDKSIGDVTTKQYSQIEDWKNKNKGYENNPLKMIEYFQIVQSCIPEENEKVIKIMADTLLIKNAMLDVSAD